MPLSAFPRVSLAHLPTPLEPLPRLTEALGGPRILVKRDDCTGLALGGNKARKLEFALGQALAAGSDCVITAGGLQSNHCRQTAAAAAKLGLGCELVLNGNVAGQDADYDATGNIFLDRLLGARVHLHPAGIDRAAVMAELAEQRAAEGRRPVVIPVGASDPVGALGFVACAFEIVQQAAEQGLTIDWVVQATSSGGTQAGLVAGFLAAGSPTRVIGIDVDGAPEVLRAQVLAIASGTLELLGQDKAPLEARIELAQGYAGEGYGLPSAAMSAAVARLARDEGLLLDPVYSGKAMAGLIDLVARGRFAPDETVVFLHTGGMPTLFAYRSLWS